MDAGRNADLIQSRGHVIVGSGEGRRLFWSTILTGLLVCVDTLYIGRLKGVGKVWQYTACDAACSFAETAGRARKDSSLRALAGLGQFPTRM